MKPFDTTAKAQQVQWEAHRALGPAGRAEVAARMSEDALSVCRAGIRMRRPGLSDDEETYELLRILHGPALARAVRDRPDPSAER